MIASLFLSLSIAADPVGVRLPELAAPTPMPRPATAVTKLSADEWYIIDADTPVMVLASPEGIVSITEDAGPLKVRGKFADSNGKVESRVYRGKQVITIDAVQTGKVELLIIPVGGDAKSVIRRTLDVQAGTGPRPPPDPQPKPEPKPYVGKFRMIVIEETEQAANNRGQFFADADLQAYLASKLSGKARIADQNVVDATGKPPRDLVPYLERAKGKPLPQVYLVGDDGTILYEGDLPKTPGELLATLRKVGG